MAARVSLDYKEEKIWANEAGISLNDSKWIWLYHQFLLEWNFWLPVWETFGAFDYFVDNAEEVEIHGFELDFYTRPSSKWIFTGSYSITDGEIKKHSGYSYDSGYDPFGPPANPILGPHDFAGKDIPFSPEQTINFSVTNNLTDDLTWSSGLTYIGKIHYLDQTATDIVNQSNL